MHFCCTPLELFYEDLPRPNNSNNNEDQSITCRREKNYAELLVEYVG